MAGGGSHLNANVPTNVDTDPNTRPCNTDAKATDTNTRTTDANETKIRTNDANPSPGNFAA